jgi:hypothetical protein
MEIPGVPLPEDSTIASIVHLLEKPEDYVSAVYAKINASHRFDPPASVRIGIRGDGKFPNYRIEHPRGMEGPFRGVTHGDGAPLSARDDAWSNATMSFDEVKVLLAEVRNGRG